MNESVRKLLALQEIDERVAMIEEGLERIPALRAKAVAPQREAARAAETSKRALVEAQATLRKAEGELRDGEALLARLESSSFEVKSREAYRVMLEEMEAVKGKVSSAETQILEWMERVDRIRTELEASEKRVREVSGVADAEEEKLAKESAMLKRELAGQRESRSEWTRTIDASLLAKYERIVARRRPAVVVVAGKTCGGCHVILPPQAVAEIRRADRLVTCRDCNRILVSESIL